MPPKKDSTRKSKTDTLENSDYSPEPAVRAPRAKKVVPNTVSNNEVVKSRLAVVIDLLSSDDVETDARTTARNIAIAVKHLKEVSSLL